MSIWLQESASIQPRTSLLRDLRIDMFKHLRRGPIAAAAARRGERLQRGLQAAGPDGAAGRGLAPAHLPREEPPTPSSVPLQPSNFLKKKTNLTR